MFITTYRHCCSTILPGLTITRGDWLDVPFRLVDCLDALDQVGVWTRTCPRPARLQLETALCRRPRRRHAGGFHFGQGVLLDLSTAGARPAAPRAPALRSVFDPLSGGRLSSEARTPKTRARSGTRPEGSTWRLVMAVERKARRVVLVAFGHAGLQGAEDLIVDHLLRHCCPMRS